MTTHLTQCFPIQSRTAVCTIMVLLSGCSSTSHLGGQLTSESSACPSSSQQKNEQTGECTCSGGRVYSEQENWCICPTPAEFAYGHCFCPDGSVANANEPQACSCPEGSQLDTASGLCTCEDERVFSTAEWACVCPKQGQKWHPIDLRCQNVHELTVKLPEAFGGPFGTVTSSDGSINCSRARNECAALYWDGTDVTLHFSSDAQGSGMRWGTACGCAKKDTDRCLIATLSQSITCGVQIESL